MKTVTYDETKFKLVPVEECQKVGGVSDRFDGGPCQHNFGLTTCGYSEDAPMHWNSQEPEPPAGRHFYAPKNIRTLAEIPGGILAASPVAERPPAQQSRPDPLTIAGSMALGAAQQQQPQTVRPDPMAGIDLGPAKCSGRISGKGPVPGPDCPPRRCQLPEGHKGRCFDGCSYFAPREYAAPAAPMTTTDDMAVGRVTAPITAAERVK